MIALYAPQYLNFNHTYTFTFIAYSVVFGLWILWVNKFSDTKKRVKKITIYLLFILLFAILGFSREFLFVNINNQLYNLYYNQPSTLPP